jgi:hypothetical protein
VTASAYLSAGFPALTGPPFVQSSDYLCFFQPAPDFQGPVVD